MSLRALRSARREDGFTVIELLVAMSMLGAMFGAFAIVMGSTIRIGGEVQEGSVLQTEARSAMNQIAGELRQTYTGDTTVPLESISGTAIQFLSADRQSPFHVRRIGYQLTGGQLNRRFATSTDTDGPPWSIGTLSAWGRVLGSVVNSTVFTYFDASGNATAVPANVRTITVTLTVATKTTPSRQFTYKTSVTPRGTMF